MRYLVFTNTPAHVHLYKHVVRELAERGHDVEILARDYGCTRALLEWYDLPHTVYGYCGTSKLSLFARLPGHYASILRRALQFDPDHIFGMGAYAAHAGAVTRTPVTLVLDSEPTGLDHRISVPFARAILTPAAFRKDLGPNHYVFEGFKESAYLHPEVFTPGGEVRDRLGVGPEESYAFVRFNAFGSHHDVGRGGFDARKRRELIERLAEHATVFVSDEGGAFDPADSPGRGFDLHPALVHDALWEADLLVADSQTMVTEAALLGTPAIRSNAFVGEEDMGNFLALEEAGLIYNLDAFEDVLARATDLLDAEETKATWRARRAEYVAGTVNLSGLLVDVALEEGPIETLSHLAQPPSRAPVLP
jgi:predicted glycosyltransferase